MNLAGWNTNGSIAFGFASELVVSSTQIQIPAVGIGVLSDGVLYEHGVSASNLRIWLESPLSSTLTIDLKNVTTNNTLTGGSMTISAGGLTAYYSGSLVASQNDQLVILLTVSGSEEVLQGISWRID
jgi:hypothetical protein